MSDMAIGWLLEGDKIGLTQEADKHRKQNTPCVKECR